MIFVLTALAVLTAYGAACDFRDTLLAHASYSSTAQWVLGLGITLAGCALGVWVTIWGTLTAFGGL